MRGSAAIATVLLVASCAAFERQGRAPPPSPTCSESYLPSALDVPLIAGAIALLLATVGDSCPGGSGISSCSVGQLGGLAGLVAIPILAIDAAVGMNVAHRCRASNAAALRTTGMSPQQRIHAIRAVEQRREDVQEAALQAEEATQQRQAAARAEVEARHAAILDRVGRATGTAARWRKSMVVLDTDPNSPICAALTWTDGVKASAPDLVREGVDQVACKAGDLVVWSGAIDRLPSSPDQTRCGELAAALKAQHDRVRHSVLLGDLPAACYQVAGIKVR